MIHSWTIVFEVTVSKLDRSSKVQLLSWI